MLAADNELPCDADLRGGESRRPRPNFVRIYRLTSPLSRRAMFIPVALVFGLSDFVGPFFVANLNRCMAESEADGRILMFMERAYLAGGTLP